MLVSAVWIAPAVLAPISHVAERRLNGEPPASARDLLWAGGDWLVYPGLTPPIFPLPPRWPIPRPHILRRALLHLVFALCSFRAWRQRDRDAGERGGERRAAQHAGPATGERGDARRRAGAGAAVSRRRAGAVFGSPAAGPRHRPRGPLRRRAALRPAAPGRERPAARDRE